MSVEVRAISGVSPCPPLYLCQGLILLFIWASAKQPGPQAPRNLPPSTSRVPVGGPGL